MVKVKIYPLTYIEFIWIIELADRLYQVISFFACFGDHIGRLYGFKIIVTRDKRDIQNLN
jgi:hypothetical protein